MKRASQRGSCSVSILSSWLEWREEERDLVLLSDGLLAVLPGKREFERQERGTGGGVVNWPVAGTICTVGMGQPVLLVPSCSSACLPSPASPSPRSLLLSSSYLLISLSETQTKT